MQKIIFLVFVIVSSFKLIISRINIAKCKLNQFNNSGVTGEILFSQDVSGGPVSVAGSIDNLQTEMHGFHIHENAIIGNNCTSGGNHFNPLSTDHGARYDPINHRHIGDQGNVNKTGSISRFQYNDEIISLIGQYSIVGRSCVVHALPDDLGLDGKDSKINGNSGARIACGTVLLDSAAFFFNSALSIILLFYSFLYLI